MTNISQIQSENTPLSSTQQKSYRVNRANYHRWLMRKTVLMLDEDERKSRGMGQTGAERMKKSQSGKQLAFYLSSTGEETRFKYTIRWFVRISTYLPRYLIIFLLVVKLTDLLGVRRFRLEKYSLSFFPTSRLVCPSTQKEMVLFYLRLHVFWCYCDTI